MFSINNKTKIASFALLLLYFILAVQPWNLYFLNDDFVHIPLSTESIWIHFQFFRPVPNLLTAFEVRLFGTNAMGFHITSMALHVIATGCVILFCNELIHRYADREKYKHAGYLAASLFFIYPFHSEPVLWVIGRISIIAVIFILLSLIFFLKRSQARYFYYLSLLSFTIALFCYETSWVVPIFTAVLVFADYRKTKKNAKKHVLDLLPFWILFGTFLAARFIVLQQLVTEYEFSGHTLSPASLVSNFLRLFARTLVPQSESSTQFIAIFVAVTAILVTFFLFLRKTNSNSFLHLLLTALLIISFFPTTQIGIDTHGSEGERYLYLPSVFWIVLFTTLLYDLPLKAGRLVFFAVMLIYAILFARSASNYRHASSIAKKVISFIGGHSGQGKIIAVNIPANYQGALIFRSGFKEAVHWIHPHLNNDNTIVIPAERTYKKILSIDIIEKSALNLLDTKMVTADNKNYTFYLGSDTIRFDSTNDMLIYFNKSGKGLFLYPELN